VLCTWMRVEPGMSLYGETCCLSSDIFNRGGGVSSRTVVLEHTQLTQPKCTHLNGCLKSTSSLLFYLYHWDWSSSHCRCTHHRALQGSAISMHAQALTAYPAAEAGGREVVPLPNAQHAIGYDNISGDGRLLLIPSFDRCLQCIAFSEVAKTTVEVKLADLHLC
jgi:hypothetical protein